MVYTKFGYHKLFPRTKSSVNQKVGVCSFSLNTDWAIKCRGWWPTMWTQGFSYLRRFISLQLTYLFSCTVGYLHTYTLIVVWYGILQILFPSLIFHAQKYDDCYVYVTMKFSNQMPAIHWKCQLNSWILEGTLIIF